MEALEEFGKPVSEARAFAQKHVVELANEILEWRRSGSLQGERLRELATLMVASGSDDELQQAERLAETEALRLVAQMARPKHAAPKAGGIRPGFRYRDPSLGREWSGKGLTPRWLRDMINRGETLEELPR